MILDANEHSKEWHPICPYTRVITDKGEVVNATRIDTSQGIATLEVVQEGKFKKQHKKYKWIKLEFLEETPIALLDDFLKREDAREKGEYYESVWMRIGEYIDPKDLI